jgi:hypothetical protein
MVSERRSWTTDRKPRASLSYLVAIHAAVLEAAEHAFDDIAVFADGADERCGSERAAPPAAGTICQCTDFGQLPDA